MHTLCIEDNNPKGSLLIRNSEIANMGSFPMLGDKMVQECYCELNFVLGHNLNTRVSHHDAGESDSRKEIIARAVCLHVSYLELPPGHLTFKIRGHAVT